MKEKVTLKKLKSKEREARIDIILDAAERVFATKSFDKASMREIADEAGMATSSIYRFFPNQEALFVEAAIREHSNMVRILKESITTQGENFILEKVIETYIDFISQHDSFFRMMVILMSQGNLSKESSEKILPIMDETLDLIDSVFKKMNYKDNLRIRSRYFFATLIGISVSFNKIPGKTNEEGLHLMKQLGKVTADVITKISS